MEKRKPNTNIACNVTHCKHHCGNPEYCSLDRIFVANQTNQAKTEKETLCNSFECGSGCKD